MRNSNTETGQRKNEQKELIHKLTLEPATLIHYHWIAYIHSGTGPFVNTTAS